MEETSFSPHDGVPIPILQMEKRLRFIKCLVCVRHLPAAMESS